MTEEKKGRRLDDEAALELLLRSNDHIFKNVQKRSQCSCGCCYYCAFLHVANRVLGGGAQSFLNRWRGLVDPENTSLKSNR